MADEELQRALVSAEIEGLIAERDHYRLALAECEQQKERLREKLRHETATTRQFAAEFEKKTADLEHKLAECEQQRDALVGMDHLSEHYRKEREVAESKLASARHGLEYVVGYLENLNLGENTAQPVLRSLLATLTEAGEGGGSDES